MTGLAGSTHGRAKKMIPPGRGGRHRQQPGGRLDKISLAPGQVAQFPQVKPLQQPAKPKVIEQEEQGENGEEYLQAMRPYFPTERSEDFLDE